MTRNAEGKVAGPGRGRTGLYVTGSIFAVVFIVAVIGAATVGTSFFVQLAMFSAVAVIGCGIILCIPPEALPEGAWHRSSRACIDIDTLSIETQSPDTWNSRRMN